jgi:hypothetical protein
MMHLDEDEPTAVIDGEQGPDFPWARTFLQECQVQLSLCRPCAECGRAPVIYQQSVAGTPMPYLVSPAPMWTSRGNIINLIPRLYIRCPGCSRPGFFLWSTTNPQEISSVWNRMGYRLTCQT